MRRAKTTTMALLLSSLVLAGPVAGAPDRGDRGGRGKQRVERAQQSQQQGKRAQAQERRQARKAQAEQRRAARQEVRQQRAARVQQRAERRPARVERVQARNESRQAARAEQRREARAERADRKQERRAVQQARVEQRRELAAERSRAGRERAEVRRLDRGRQDRMALQQRMEQRRDRVGRMIERRPVVVEQRQERLDRRAARLDQARERELRIERMRERQLRLEERRLRPVDRRAVAPLRQRTVGPMRFRGLDRDGDGRIARWEWRGNERSFRNHDWNGDGILLGAEVTPGARRTRLVQRWPRVARVTERWAPVAERWAPVTQPWPVVTQRVSARWVERQRIQAVWPWLTRAERSQVAGGFGPSADELERRAWERQRQATFQPERLSWFDRQAWLPWSWRADRVVVQPVTVIDPIPLPPLADFVWTGFDETLYERQVRVHDFGPVDLIVSRVDLDPVDRVLVVDRFSLLDRDRDRFVSMREWPGPRPLFYDLDRDHDDLLVVDDLLVSRDRLEPVLAVDRERYVAFHLLDVDDDGVLAPWEWGGDLDLFFYLDVDDDGVLEQNEYLGLARTTRVPLRMAYGGDLDDDGRLMAVEWVGDPYRFAKLDIDDDHEIEPHEALIGWALRT